MQFIYNSSIGNRSNNSIKIFNKDCAYYLNISQSYLRKIVLLITKKDASFVVNSSNIKPQYRTFKLSKYVIKYFKNNPSIYNNSKETITIIKKELDVENKINNFNDKIENKNFSHLNQKIMKYEELPGEWKEINYHLLEDYHFKAHHIVNFYKLNLLEPEIIQESINHFAYGIKHNPNNYSKYNDPLKVFIGRLRKGEPWIESTYKSKQEIATKEMILRRKEEKRTIANEICKLVDTLEKDSYEKWLYSLKEEEKKEIRNSHSLKETGIYDYYNEKILKLYYAKTIMEDYKDPKEKALEEFLELKKEKQKRETKRITEIMQDTGAMKDYYLWLEQQSIDNISKIVGKELLSHDSMVQKDVDKLKVYFAKNVLMMEK